MTAITPPASPLLVGFVKVRHVRLVAVVFGGGFGFHALVLFLRQFCGNWFYGKNMCALL
jgi:hypothetical protein